MHSPQYAVSKWIGHSIAVSGKHYANSVPDELFDRVAKGGAESGALKAQNEAQQCAAVNRGQSQYGVDINEKAPKSGASSESVHGDAMPCEIGVTGFEPATSWSRNFYRLGASPFNVAGYAILQKGLATEFRTRPELH